jgi:hypothetical protein
LHPPLVFAFSICHRNREIKPASQPTSAHLISLLSEVSVWVTSSMTNVELTSYGCVKPVMNVGSGPQSLKFFQNHP